MRQRGCSEIKAADRSGRPACHAGIDQDDAFRVAKVSEKARRISAVFHDAHGG
jgi:hypothetical protein